MAKMTYARSIRDAIDSGVDSVSKRKDGTIVLRRGFYYRNGMDAESFFLFVSKKLNAAGIKFSVKDYGEKWTTFRGGASLATQSHWWVELWPEVDSAR